MTASVLSPSALRTPVTRAPSVARPDAPPTLPRRPELDTISRHWQHALDSATSALDAGTAVLAPAEIGSRKRRLTAERSESSSLLRSLAHIRAIKPEPWLSLVPVTPRMLGLDRFVRGCVFDLDGVLTDSGQLHAAAWAHVFDSFLLQLAHETGWQFIPFDRASDYRAYLDGRLRIEGIHAFLASRGIHLPEGHAEDGADVETAHGLARRKGELLRRALETHGLAPLPGARRYLQATGHARLGRAVVSASSSTVPMLEVVGLDHLVDARVDAAAMQRDGLHPRPAPDLLLAACRGLGIPPDQAATLTNSGPGVVAGRRAGLVVIGIGSGAQGELLRDFGAERVVPSLWALLDSRLAQGLRDEPHRRA